MMLDEAQQVELAGHGSWLRRDRSGFARQSVPARCVVPGAASARDPGHAVPLAVCAVAARSGLRAGENRRAAGGHLGDLVALLVGVVDVRETRHLRGLAGADGDRRVPALARSGTACGHEIAARRGWIVATETILLLGLVAASLVRRQNPDLWIPDRNGSQLQNMATFNALVRTPHFPAYDPGFAGGHDPRRGVRACCHRRWWRG